SGVSAGATRAGSRTGGEDCPAVAVKIGARLRLSQCCPAQHENNSGNNAPHISRTAQDGAGFPDTLQIVDQGKKNDLIFGAVITPGRLAVRHSFHSFRVSVRVIHQAVCLSLKRIHKNYSRECRIYSRLKIATSRYVHEMDVAMEELASAKHNAFTDLCSKAG